MYRRCAATCLAFVLSVGGLSACHLDSASRQIEVVVFAASSLTNAFDELADVFEADHEGVKVIRHYSSSSQLAAQLIEGIPADIFAPANLSQMEAVIRAGHISGQPEIFASNRLVILVPFDNPAGILNPRDLSNSGVRLVLAAPGVPAREYADQMLAAFSTDKLFGSAFDERVYANLVSEEDNVRRVAAKIALGEADAGIVYASDVTPDIAAQVMQIAIPDSVNVVAVYPISLVAGSRQPELARAFVDLILSPRGQGILTRWGFGPVDVP